MRTTGRTNNPGFWVNGRSTHRSRRHGNGSRTSRREVGSTDGTPRVSWSLGAGCTSGGTHSRPLPPADGPEWSPRCVCEPRGPRDRSHLLDPGPSKTDTRPLLRSGVGSTVKHVGGWVAWETRRNTGYTTGDTTSSSHSCKAITTPQYSAGTDQTHHTRVRADTQGLGFTQAQGHGHTLRAGGGAVGSSSESDSESDLTSPR